ncbi:cAMP phosphodiesterases class-II-domain-containing protein [Daldinia bambusicola]|nr:cAMP phosphodiesterases class-II-domain-containing protein [Daldinia bambusicola]
MRNASQPALQVIVLGASGGPLEDNVTAFLIRSVKTNWSRGSLLALDGGVHLSAITKILEETQPPGLGSDIALPHVLKTGPFAGMEIHYTSASANALEVSRNLVDSYLVTHPHLDHISGFVLNTAAPPGTKPKRIAGLPSTISAFKTHIFNNVIWPNLSDENNGAGLVTYMRLVEGGSPALGEGADRGYLEVSDGLTVKVFSVSHGHCIEKHAHRGSSSSSRFGSTDGTSLMSQRGGSVNGALGPSPLLRNGSRVQTTGDNDRESVCVYDSSAYFIKDALSGREVLMIGDVEPDSISLSPRNIGVWLEAAPKIATGNLAAIFMECSYDDGRMDDMLYGHLSPRYVIQEMQTLAAEVERIRQIPTKLESIKKRKREMEESGRRTNRTIARATDGPLVVDDRPVSPKSMRPPRARSNSRENIISSHITASASDMSFRDASILRTPKMPNALRGLKVVIIHVKESFNDEKPAGDEILKELLAHEEKAKLGCEFIISKRGQSLMF